MDMASRRLVTCLSLRWLQASCAVASVVLRPLGNHGRGFERGSALPRDALHQLLCSAVVFRAGHHASLMPLDY